MFAVWLPTHPKPSTHHQEWTDEDLDLLGDHVTVGGLRDRQFDADRPDIDRWTFKVS